MDAAIRFRTAERADTPLILRFIRELAAYEQLLDQVVADESTLEEWLFDRKKGGADVRLDGIPDRRGYPDPAGGADVR